MRRRRWSAPLHARLAAVGAGVHRMPHGPPDCLVLEPSEQSWSGVEFGYSVNLKFHFCKKCDFRFTLSIIPFPKMILICEILGTESHYE